MKLIHWLLFGALVGSIAFPAKADPWDKVDTALGITTAALIIIDWGQTRYIAKHPDDFYEKNNLLGEHPSVGRVNTHFVIVMAGTYLFADYLSSSNRKVFLGTMTILELNVVGKNRSLGVRMQF